MNKDASTSYGTDFPLQSNFTFLNNFKVKNIVRFIKQNIKDTTDFCHTATVT